MSLLKLALSSNVQRTCQQALPALCAALGANSTAAAALQSVQQQGTGSVLGAFSSRNSNSSSPRSFHTARAAFSADQDLASILAQEVKHEKTTYEQDEVVAKGPPAPFKLSSTPGDTTVTLTREHKGETISVDASVNMQDTLAVPFEESDDEGADQEEPNDVNFNVSVSKGGKSLVFECMSDGTYVDIRHVSFEPQSGVESETSYTGPVFAELDDNLQESFRTYLAERGINEDMGEYIRHLLYDKELLEYRHWLEGVQAFVSSK